MSWYNPFTWGNTLSGGFFSKNFIEDGGLSTEHFEEYNGRNASQLRSNAKYLNANDDFVSAIRHAEERGVIGKSLNIQSVTDDIDFNKAFEKQIRKWSKLGNCELTGRMHFSLACRTMVGMRKIQGGVLIRHHMSNKWNIPYKFEILGLDQINKDKDDFKNGLFGGIQVNRFNEITGVWLYKGKDRRESVFVKYKELTLYVVPFVDITQYQGITEIAPVLNTLKMLREYSYEELKRAKRDSKNSIIVKSASFAQVLSAKIKKAMGEGKVQDMTKALEEAKISGAVEGAIYVPNTDDVTLLNKDAKTIYDSLQSNTQTMGSAGTGASPQTVLKNVKDVNYTSALFNSQNDNGYFEIGLDNLEGLVLDDMMGRLLDALVMTGKIIAKDYFIDRDEYLMLEFMRKSTVHNDIAKTAKATDTSLANGSLTMIDHLASQNIDHETHIRKQIKYKQAQARIAKELGYVEPIESEEEK
jgi:capsid protein